jgi:hypothetical protein
MPTIELGPLTGVTSTSVIQADLGDNLNLLVISGIAIPNWFIDDWGRLYFQDFLVHLGVYALNLTQSSVVVALCSIRNNNSSFTFALNDASVALSSDTGELLLTVNAALSGARTELDRFSYQIVATVEPVVPKITGTIAWPTELWNPPSLDAAVIQAQLAILANQFVPGTPGSFGSSVTVAKGTITSVVVLDLPTPGKLGQLTPTCIANYEIDNPPLYAPLSVVVTPSSIFKAASGSAIGVAQVSGPLQFSLTTTTSTIECDFRIGAFTPSEIN